jgi:hypothetical protein
MTLTLATIPKEAKTLPAEAQQIFLATYNKDFGWRCSEAHAAKAAWLAVGARWPESMPKE